MLARMNGRAVYLLDSMAGLARRRAGPDWLVLSFQLVKSAAQHLSCLHAFC